ncbi:2-aminoethylphosphonate--pyruvate transaminase [Burkholderia oklahomensis]|uniref:2-aminoethylphosphonate--pyruvate transaminase n=1 Tax=Burkholderia oklahomensis TaxID=342113 RepID=UPI0026545A26|nr:2-aminoethylphosphonate--pyruvate transaminase [Burkholderia oklahomensis]MDN7671669.1 2-aminoethylphosphonate--pyruvate transaminase [Burkholderia oklahomensis]
MNDDNAERTSRTSVTRHRLFTPGPLTTSDAVRAAAAVDLGSRSLPATALTQRLRAKIARIAGCGSGYSVVPIQGSGTFAVEAMLCSLLADDDHVLIVENGAYSERMTEICRIHGIRHDALACGHTERFDLPLVDRALAASPHVTHVAAVHFETALGVPNDVAGLVSLAARHGRRVLLDAISTFGAYPLDFAGRTLAAVALSSNKCLHGLPGLGFVIADETALMRRPRPRTLSLDLLAQHRALESNRQWRYTPPIQIMRALDRAIDEYDEAGGQAARLASYRRRAQRLLDGLARVGIAPVIDAANRAPIITTFATPPPCPRPCRRARAISVRARARNLSDQALESGLVPGRRDRRNRRRRRRRTRPAHVRIRRVAAGGRGAASRTGRDAARGGANAVRGLKSANRHRPFVSGESS